MVQILSLTEQNGEGRRHNDVHVHVDGLLECRWLTGYSWLYFLYEWTMHGWIIPHRHRDNAVRVTAAPPGPVSWSCVTDTTVGNPSTCFLSPPDSCNLLSLRSLFFYLLFSPFGGFGSDNGKLHKVWKQIRYVNRLNDKQGVYILQLLWFKDTLRLASNIISILSSLNRSTIRWYLTYM